MSERIRSIKVIVVIETNKRTLQREVDVGDGGPIGELGLLIHETMKSMCEEASDA